MKKITKKLIVACLSVSLFGCSSLMTENKNDASSIPETVEMQVFAQLEEKPVKHDFASSTNKTSFALCQSQLVK